MRGNQRVNCVLVIDNCGCEWWHSTCTLLCMAVYSTAIQTSV
ncbi:unnamed protein product, partial [Staurois parvus]